MVCQVDDSGLLGLRDPVVNGSLLPVIAYVDVLQVDAHLGGVVELQGPDRSLIILKNLCWPLRPGDGTFLASDEMVKKQSKLIMDLGNIHLPEPIQVEQVDLM